MKDSPFPAWKTIVANAMWQIYRGGYVTREEIDSFARALKIEILTYLESGKPLHFLGSQQLVLKKPYKRKVKKCGQTQPSSDAGQN